MDPGSITTIVSAPGQIVAAAVALKKLYDAFFDQHRNAETEAREFAQLVSTFAINLVNQERLISRAGKFFPGEENFLRTIDQCTIYLKGYDNLLREKAKAQAVRRVLEITKWQADLAGERKRLVENLNIHVNSMNSFSMNVLLEIALRDREAIRPFSTATNQVPTAVEDDQTMKDFHKLYNHLYDSIVVLQNRQKRDKRYERMPDLVMTDLKGIIDQWRRILIQSGMSEDRLPELPERASEQETFESSVNRWRRDIYLEQSLRNRSSSIGSRSSSNGSSTPTSRRDSLASLPPDPTFPKASPHPEMDVTHSPIDNVLFAPSPDPIPGSSIMPGRSPSINSIPPSEIFDRSPVPSHRTWSSAMTDQSLMSQKDRRASSISEHMGRSASVSSMQPLAEVKWEGQNKHTMQLYAYEVDDARKPRILYLNKGTNHQVDHILSKPMHPFTKHSRLKRPLEVSFIEGQELKLNTNNSRKSYKPCHPVYSFTDDSELKRFQSIVHGRQLLETFEVEKVTTSGSSKLGDATDQHVKIWKSNESNRHYLGFYANGVSPQQHRMLLVGWFERPDPPAPGNKSVSVRLTFKKSSTRPSAHSRRSSRSLSFTSRKSSTVSASVSPTPESRPTSAFLENDDPPCPEEIQKLAYFELRFASPKFRNDFVTAFTRAMDGTLAAGPSPTIPEIEPISEVAEVATSFAHMTFEARRATPAKLLGLTHV